MSYQQFGMDEKARNLFSKISNWNDHSIEYAPIRNKANAMAKKDMAIEEK